MSWYYFKPYVTVAQRRAKAAREIEKRKKKGQSASPVVIEGRIIANTFWGKAWCENLESYSDFSNRLPRGRTYIRNGSVVDLQIAAGNVKALVSGSELYEVEIIVGALRPDRWKKVKSQCAGKIGSLVELLQGRLSRHVMDIVTRRDGGLFPQPSEIEMSCSCPDWAGMCKHVAAVLYGVGARLDQRPDFLFQLRQVDHLELIQEATSSAPAGSSARRGKRTIADQDLGEVFGIELGDADGSKDASRPTDAPDTIKRRRATAAKAAGRTRLGRVQKVAADSAPTESGKAGSRVGSKKTEADKTEKGSAARVEGRRAKASKNGLPVAGSAARRKASRSRRHLHPVQSTTQGPQ